MSKPDEGDGGGDSGGDGGADPTKQPPQKDPVKQDPKAPADDFQKKYEAAEAARKALETERDGLRSRLTEATKGRMTDAERIAALETSISEFTERYDALNANFGALKTTYDTEQAEKKTLADQERTDLVAKLKAARPGLDEKNLSKCDLLFLRDLAKNVAPPAPSAIDVKQEAFQATRDKRIAELREKRKAKSKA